MFDNWIDHNHLLLDLACYTVAVELSSILHLGKGKI
jgi:hypothetical protein